MLGNVIRRYHVSWKNKFANRGLFSAAFQLDCQKDIQGYISVNASQKNLWERLYHVLQLMQGL